MRTLLGRVGGFDVGLPRHWGRSVDATGQRALVTALREVAVTRAEALYLDDAHPYDCAETTFMTLKGMYGLDDPTDPAAAIALNGGVGYSGGPCGAITGAALAVGILAEQRIEDHNRAKLVARELLI